MEELLQADLASDISLTIDPVGYVAKQLVRVLQKQ